MRHDMATFTSLVIVQGPSLARNPNPNLGSFEHEPARGENSAA